MDKGASTAFGNAFMLIPKDWPLIVGFGVLEWAYDMLGQQIGRQENPLMHYGMEGLRKTTDQGYYYAYKFPTQTSADLAKM